MIFTIRLRLTFGRNEIVIAFFFGSETDPFLFQEAEPQIKRKTHTGKYLPLFY